MEGGLSNGQTLLVHGGAGSLGTAAIQLGKAFGAKVITTDSPQERCDFCLSLGADQAIDFRKDDFVDLVRAAGGANMILDIVGGPNIEKNIKAASPAARIVQLAFSAGSRVDIDLMPVMLKKLVITGSTLRTRPSEFKTRVAEELQAMVWPQFAARKIRHVTSHIFPLAEATAAHRLMEAGGQQGKILILPTA